MNVCPRGGEGEALFTNEEDGFCLLFPDHFRVRHNDTIYSMTVVPYDEAFPQASEDVARVWNLALRSFKFMR